MTKFYNKMPSDFRTIVAIEKAKFDIDYQDKVLLIGSCFTQNIGDKLQANQFQTLTNPFGIVFNPHSIFQQLQLLQTQEIEALEPYFFEYNGLYHSWQHHSCFSNEKKADFKQKIHTKFEASKAFLQNTKYLVITLGTAFAYKHIQHNFIVNNCHQVPNKQFEKVLLTAQTISENFTKIFKKLKTNNPNLQIIFTISPIRHWKDGVQKNQLSKANLLVAVHQLCDVFDFCHYFPAYEIMLDDLRDYRFYKADMLHPNQQAVAYIWQKFQTSYFNPHTLELIYAIDKLNKAKNHRPRFPKSDSHLAFLKKIELEEKLLIEQISRYKKSQ